MRCVFLSRLRSTAINTAVLLLAGLLVSCSLESVQEFLTPRFRFSVSNRAMQKELDTALSIILSGNLKKSGYFPLQRMLAARRVGAILIADGQKAQAARFFTTLADEHDSYEPWYLFSAAGVYESMGGAPIARLFYERIVEALPDISVEGKSIHRICLARLLSGTLPPEKKISWYREFIRRFPDAEETGPYHFLLAKEYEKTGQWSTAIEEYRRFLSYFGVSVPGYPDAFEQARKMVEFSDSPKDWTYRDLNELVSGIRKAIASRSSAALRKYMSKAGFFAMSWYKEGGQDANSSVIFNFSNFMTRGPIYVAPALDPQINENEAFLRTSGWTGYIPVWYLCFRRIYFPADPNVHGNWEWAGIYFGEKLQ
ncbi:MAG: tetratricopeptide repeat protein [Rectinema sp.]|nr:tetratricopeptide repeat protein [Rectinema sp.]